MEQLSKNICKNNEYFFKSSVKNDLKGVKKEKSKRIVKKFFRLILIFEESFLTSNIFMKKTEKFRKTNNLKNKS